MLKLKICADHVLNIKRMDSTLGLLQKNTKRTKWTLRKMKVVPQLAAELGEKMNYWGIVYPLSDRPQPLGKNLSRGGCRGGAGGEYTVTQVSNPLPFPTQSLNVAIQVSLVPLLTAALCLPPPSRQQYMRYLVENSNLPSDWPLRSGGGRGEGK